MTTRMGLILILILILCLTVAGLATGTTTKPAGPTTRPAASQPTSAPSDVAAEIEGKKLTYGAIAALKKYLFGNKVTSEDIIARWKINAVLANDARKSELMNDPYAQAAIDVVTKEIFVNIYMRYYQQNIKIADEEALAEYTKHEKGTRFRRAPIVSVKLIAMEDKEQLQKVREQLVAGEDFDTLMNKYSDETKKLTGLDTTFVKQRSTKVLGTNLGFVVTNQLAVKANLDRIKGPILVHGKNFSLIFKAVEYQQGELKPFEEVRDGLKRSMLFRKKRSAMTKLRESAEKRAGVKMPQPKRQRQGPSARSRSVPVRPSPKKK